MSVNTSLCSVAEAETALPKMNSSLAEFAKYKQQQQARAAPSGPLSNQNNSQNAGREVMGHSDSEEGSGSDAVSWMEIASDPRANRSPKAHRLANSAVVQVRCKRGAQHPNRILIDQNLDIYDFDAQKHYKVVQGFIFKQSLPNEVAQTLQGKRGTRVGEANDVLTMDDVRAQRRAKEAAVEAKAETKIRRAQAKRAAQEKKVRDAAALKENNKKLRADKRVLERDTKAARHELEVLQEKLGALEAKVGSQDRAPDHVKQYCYCRKPYVEGEFMIGCAAASELWCPGNLWFHPRCIGKTSRAAHLLPETWRCHACAAREEAK